MGVKLKIGSMADMLALGAERRKRWRLRHEEFLHIVLSARAAKRAELGEEPLVIEPLSAEVTQAGLVLCEKCGRRFSEGVFEKHKDLCKEVRDLQATDLTEEQKDAKARFLKRMKYSRHVCGRVNQQESTGEKENSTSEPRTELYPPLSCAAEMQKMQSLLKDIIPNLSNATEKLQQSDVLNQFLQQLLPAGFPPSRDDALLQISNCNKTVMPNCKLVNPPESDSRSVSQFLCDKNNLRKSSVGDDSPKYSSPSAVSSISSLSTFSPPLDSSSDYSQKGSLEDAEEELKHKAEGTSKGPQCLPGAVPSRPSTIEPKFLTDCLPLNQDSGCCLKMCRTATTDSSKLATDTALTNAAVPASDGDIYVTPPNTGSNAEQPTHLTNWKAKHQHSRPHGQPKINNYVRNNCKSSSGANTGLSRFLPTCSKSRSIIPVKADASEAKNTSASERHHHCHRHHQHRHHQRPGHSAVPPVDGHQSQKKCEPYCETGSCLANHQDFAVFASSTRKNCVRPSECCPQPQVEICRKEAQEASQTPLCHSNTGSSPVFYQFVKTMEAGDRDSNSRFQDEIEKPVLPGSPCGSNSVTSASFMSAVTSNSQYWLAKASDQFNQSTTVSPTSSLSLVYLDVDSAPSDDVSMRSGNVVKPFTFSSETYKSKNLPAYTLGNVTSVLLTQTLRSDTGTFRPSQDRPVVRNEQEHLMGKEGPPTTMLQNISISDNTESLAHYRFCSQCGERFFEDAKFCGLCGTSRRFGRQPSLAVTEVRPKVNFASGQASSS
uniref:Zinc finger C2HC domain-containing protein T03G11.3 n=1 Tax=Schistocephalus solidus TaxID=70667 RepID=A0A0X3PXQ6_SCHSO